MGEPNKDNNPIFKTTRWTLISQMRNLGDPSSSKLRDELYRDYWQPIFSYIYRRCRNHEQASDLTQEFFTKCIIENNLFEKAEKCKGKFRGLLVTSLKHFLISENRYNNSEVRMPERELKSLDNIAFAQQIAAPATNMSDEDFFNYSWIQTILKNVTDRLEEHYRCKKMIQHWQAFDLRVMTPIRNGTAPATVPEIMEATGIKSEIQVSNAILTVKRKFRVELKNHIREYVNNENEVNEEITEFSHFLKNFLQDS